MSVHVKRPRKRNIVEEEDEIVFLHLKLNNMNTSEASAHGSAPCDVTRSPPAAAPCSESHRNRNLGVAVTAENLLDWDRNLNFNLSLLYLSFVFLTRMTRENTRKKKTKWRRALHQLFTDSERSGQPKVSSLRRHFNFFSVLLGVYTHCSLTLLTTFTQTRGAEEFGFTRSKFYVVFL